MAIVSPTTMPAVQSSSRVHAGRVMRIGLIGAGERGTGNATSIAKTTSAALAMVMDVDRALAEDVGRRFGVPWTTSLEELLHSDAVDAVLISTPNHLHAEQVIHAAQARKHIMVEKPLATSLEDAAAACEAARAAQVRLSVFLSYRYLPQIQKARALIDQGMLGELLGISLMFQHDKGIGYWQGGYTARSASDWRTRRETSGGGVLIHSAIHYLDWLRYLGGHEVSEVSATAATLDSPAEVEDAMTLWLRYENGALGTVNAVSCARGTNFLAEFRLWGRNGHLSLTPPPQFYSLRRIDGKRPGQWHEFGRLPRSRHHVDYIQRFAERVLEGEEPEITGRDGLAVQAIVEAAYLSSRTGRPVQVERHS